jgi:hypothetical protein
MVRSWLVLFAAAAVVFVSASASTSIAATVYFLVSEFPDQREHGDSFVLPLSDDAHIAHARDLVARGRDAGSYLIAADIVAGADNINRNILADGKPAWSWHISHFEQFADASIELTDGWPGFIESDVQGWINNTGGGTIDNDGDGEPDGPPPTVGRIAFWSYTVTAELTGSPTDLSIVPRTVVPLPAALPAGAAMLALAGVALRKVR